MPVLAARFRFAPDKPDNRWVCEHSEGQGLDLIFLFSHLNITVEAVRDFEPAIEDQVESVDHLLELIAAEDLRIDELRDSDEQ